MKTLKIIGIVIGVILIVVIIFFIVSVQQQESSPTSNILSTAYLEKIPAGTSYAPGIKGVFTTTFTKDDQMLLRTETESLVGKATLKAKIAKEGEDPGNDVMPPSVIKSGSFEYCCIAVPSEPGKYFLHLYTNDKEEELSPLSFEVVE